jgi:hypothetical protein
MTVGQLLEALDDEATGSSLEVKDVEEILDHAATA